MRPTKLITLLSIVALPLFSIAQDSSFLKKYAGTYIMLVDGQKEPATPDKYVFNPDGKCEWTMTFQNDAGKTEVKKTPGTWTASEGLIQMKFTMGDGEGAELISDYRLKDGVFHSSENVYLKKVVQKVVPKATSKVAPKAIKK